MIDGLEPYSKYRDAGMPWLGLVPSHWDVQRLKYLLCECDSRSVDGSEQLLRVSQHTGVTQRKRSDGSAEPDTRAESLVGYKRVRADELVVNIMLAWNGSLGVSAFAGIVSPAYCVYSFTQAVEPRFFHHLLRSPGLKARIKMSSRGVVDSRLRLYSDDLFRIAVPVPPLGEQQAIVRFLEHADRHIRRYVRAKQKLIGLLKEQKQACIEQAVTKGLDSRVRLRDSGWQWLGDVPAHWPVLPLKRRWKVVDCKHVTVPFVEQGLPLASVREVQRFELSLATAKRTTAEWFAHLVSGDRRPAPGDLIYCRNVSVGACAYVDTDEPFAMGQDVCLIRSKAESGRFLNYFMHSLAMKRQLSVVLVGSTFDRINVSEVKGLNVVIPPRDEQDEIVKYLDKKMQRYDTPINAAQRDIALMMEYRVRLTADVVTGKLDVRAAARRLKAETADFGCDEAEPMSDAEGVDDLMEADAALAVGDE